MADRLYKLRHCQNIAGAPLELALFDAPIDPGLLIAAQAAGVDLTSVLSDLGAPCPITGSRVCTRRLRLRQRIAGLRISLQAAIEKSDAGALDAAAADDALQLLQDGDQVLDWQVQQAQSQSRCIG